MIYRENFRTVLAKAFIVGDSAWSALERTSGLSEDKGTAPVCDLCIARQYEDVEASAHTIYRGSAGDWQDCPTSGCTRKCRRGMERR